MAHRVTVARVPGALLWFLTLCLVSGPLLVTGGAANTYPLGLIVVESLERAEQIQERLAKGESFAALAHEHSVDPTARDGGFLGSIDPESLRLELRDALQGVGPGQVSAIVRIPAGYALLKRLPTPSSPETDTADRSRLLAVDAQASARLTTDASGHVELMQAMRNIMPAGGRWGLDLAEVCETRTQAPLRGIADLRRMAAGEDAAGVDPAVVHYAMAGLLSASGRTDEAIDEWETAYNIATKSSPEKFVRSMEQVLGIGYLHRATSPNRESTAPINDTQLVPTRPGTAKTRQADSEKAIAYLSRALAHDSSNTEVQWLLNLAHMTAGSYPAGVPKEFLLSPAMWASTGGVGRFLDVAPAVGVNVVGTAGGAIADDFDGDGLLDLVTSEIDDCAPLHYFHNNGDGTFANRTAQAGLSGQTGGLNITHADYNNDGCVDLLVLRGGWEFARRRSLLRNNCDATFQDVTAATGLLEPMRSSQSAVWADIDNDGRLDLFVANENAPAQLFLATAKGTFVDIAREAGVDRTAFSKAVVSADYDLDGDPDFFVSNSNGPAFLYRNAGDRTFAEVSVPAGVFAPRFAFGAWFFDYDNDGWPDLFVTSYYGSAEESARSYMGAPRKGETLKLFQNMKDGTFRDVTADVGLDRIFLPMGCNFGDVDNDGFLDFYLGMGTPSFASVFPNTLFHNQAGKRFVDISTSSGTGAIAKGHGVAFADFDNNGDEDLFVVMGGATEGDRHPARLFENPGGHGNDWITLRLVGETSNRSAIGARIVVTVINAETQRRTIVRTVGSGGSFGGSPFQQHIGLGPSARIESVEISWPASKTRRIFTDVAPNQFLEIKESAVRPTPLSRPSFRLGGAARGASGNTTRPPASAN